uniref:G-protein coupled receptors family 1 profile domain-containing protein n=1 Tax=Anopheles atroparvus TaxID=41427 RepID=A0A182JBU8_ANOAO
MPLELYGTWKPFAYPFNQVACIINGLLSETAANATVLTITSFTVERYIAICHPFRSHTMSKLSRAIKFVIAIWLVAFGLATPQALQFGIVETNTSRLCTIKDQHFVHAFEVSSFLFFVGPMTLIAVLYVLIGIKLRKSKLLQGVKRASSDYTTPPRGISAQTRVIRMLVAVVATFFICWAPFHAQRLMAVYGAFTNMDSIYFDQVYTALNYISGVLYFLSTCINPLLYNIMSHKFRDASKHTLKVSCCGGRRCQSDGAHHTYSAVSRYGVTGGGSFKLNSNNMTCIGGTITPFVGPGATTANCALLGVSSVGPPGTPGARSHGLCHQETNMSLLSGESRCHRTVPSYALVRGSCTRATDSSCVSITSTHSTTGTNVSSTNGTKPYRSANGTAIRHGACTGHFATDGGPSTGRLSTIAEKLRRGTKKVLALSKSPVGTPCKSTTPVALDGDGAEVSERRRKAYRKRQSCDSVDTDTISNSSLKEFDEDEFSSAELARFMGEVNSEIR